MCLSAGIDEEEEDLLALLSGPTLTASSINAAATTSAIPVEDTDLTDTQAEQSSPENNQPLAKGVSFAQDVTINAPTTETSKAQQPTVMQPSDSDTDLLDLVSKGNISPQPSLDKQTAVNETSNKVSAKSKKGTKKSSVGTSASNKKKQASGVKSSVTAVKSEKRRSSTAQTTVADIDESAITAVQGGQSVSVVVSTADNRPVSAISRPPSAHEHRPPLIIVKVPRPESAKITTKAAEVDASAAVAKPDEAQTVVVPIKAPPKHKPLTLESQGGDLSKFAAAVAKQQPVFNNPTAIRGRTIPPDRVAAASKSKPKAASVKEPAASSSSFNDVASLLDELDSLDGNNKKKQSVAKTVIPFETPAAVVAQGEVFTAESTPSIEAVQPEESLKQDVTLNTAEPAVPVCDIYLMIVSKFIFLTCLIY